MKRYLLVGASVLLLMGAIFAVQAGAADQTKILDFDAMAGLPAAYAGGNDIRGVPAGGLPWVIDLAKGRLRASGRLDVLVKGLVLDPNDPAVIDAGLAGMNPFNEFYAIVSCLSVDADGNPVTVNMMTGPFPATTGLDAGDTHIMAVVELPSPCLAPVIFVGAKPADTVLWFAVTGYGNNSMAPMSRVPTGLSPAPVKGQTQ